MSAPAIISSGTAAGGPPVGGSGTIDTIPRWSGVSTLGDSLLSQSGAIVTNSGTFRAANGAVSEPAYTFSASSGTGMYRATSGALLRFAVSGAYAFGVDTNGNVGIGTASPGRKLEVLDTTTGGVVQGIRITGNASNYYDIGRDPINGAFTIVGSQAGVPLITFLQGANERARIDSSGNFSIGYTGGSWSSTYTGMFLNRGLSFMARDGGDTYISANAIYDSSNAWKYVASGSTASTQIAFQGGATVFSRAVAGTAGSALTWLESARIESNGRFIVAGTGATESLQVNAGFRIASAANAATSTAAQPGVFSYEYPITRTYVGDGSGYTWAVSRRGGSVTTDMMYIADNVGSLFVPGADCYFYGVRVGRGAGAVSTNTAVGASALDSNTTGTANTAVGYEALRANASATNSTAVGMVALRDSTGGGNTAFGSNAGRLNTTGSNNTSVGHQAGYSVTTTSNNVSVGQNSALYQTGYNNTVVGAQAAQGALGASTGYSNTAIGVQSAYNLTAGVQNTAIGSQAMYGLQGGSRNTAVGEAALYTNVSGTDNTAVGRYAAVFNTGSSNTAVGAAALQGTSGSSGLANTAVGQLCLTALTTGGYNACVGYNAGGNITTGSSNIIVGTDAQTAAATDSNQLVLGSAARFVATNGGATTYYATAGASLGYIQVRLNGANVKIQVFAP